MYNQKPTISLPATAVIYFNNEGHKITLLKKSEHFSTLF